MLVFRVGWNHGGGISYNLLSLSLLAVCVRIRLLDAM